MVIDSDLLAKLLPYHCLLDPESEFGDVLASFASTSGGAFLEIGTHKGATSAAVAVTFPRARVVTIDLPDSTSTRWNPLPRRLVGEAHRALGVTNQIEQRFMDSTELWRLAGRGEVYDMVFIDGDHSPEAVFRDLILSADLLPRDGGLLLVHDYTDPQDVVRPEWTHGVQQAVDRFIEVRPFHKRRLSGLLLALDWIP